MRESAEPQPLALRFSRALSACISHVSRIYLASPRSVQFNQIKVGDAKKGNEPTPWAEVPTLASLKAQFGDFHFGWVEKPTAKPVES